MSRSLLSESFHNQPHCRLWRRSNRPSDNPPGTGARCRSPGNAKSQQLSQGPWLEGTQNTAQGCSGVLILRWSIAFHTTMWRRYPNDATSFGFSWCQARLVAYLIKFNTIMPDLANCLFKRKLSTVITAGRPTWPPFWSSTTGSGASIKVSPLTPLTIHGTWLGIASLPCLSDASKNHSTYWWICFQWKQQRGSIFNSKKTNIPLKQT